VSISGIIQGVTGQLREYDPEELSEEMRDILEDIDKKIQEEQTKIDSIGTKKKYRNLPKADKEHLIKKHNLKIEDLEEQKKNILFESHEKDFFHMETLSFDERKDRNVETDPDVSKEMRRRHGVSEGRRMRHQLAKERAKARIAAGEVTAETPEGIKSSEVKTANIVVANKEWGKLSNLSPNSFEYDGRQYRSVEHAYQTLKSGEFHEPTYREYLDRPQAMKIASGPPADKATNIQLMEDLYKQMLSENPETLELLNKTEGMKITHILGSGKEGIWGKEMPRILTKLRDEFKSTGGETPNIKTSGTQYNVIEPNPRYTGPYAHYVWRTQYNYANSDITLDFTATGEPSGAGNSAGKGTPDFKKKWTNVAVDNAGKLTASNIDEVAQKLADALTSGQTVNIAGHGNYESIRGGFPKAVWQSQVDGSMQTIFDRAIELAGDKPITGKVISGGQSGFDEAGIRVARNLGIPTEVNVQDYTWRDAGGEHIKDEQGFKDRIDADSYDSETYEGKSRYTPLSDTGLEISQVPEERMRVISSNTGLEEPQIKTLAKKFGARGLQALSVLRILEPVEEAFEYFAGKVLTTTGLSNTKIGKDLLTKGVGRTWFKAEIANLFLHSFFAGNVALAEQEVKNSMILYEGLGGEVSPEVKEQLDTNIIETYRKFFAPGKTSLYENIDKKVQDVTGKRQMEWGAHIGIKGYDWMKNVFSEASR
tara:strand:- start:1084 stop:3210 length:2127 start_codon:yes stop_codon:yes gene_type:complete